jgi:hypothetical protein
MKIKFMSKRLRLREKMYNHFRVGSGADSASADTVIKHGSAAPNSTTG